MTQSTESKTKILKEKLIVTALEEPEFLDLLKDTVGEIKTQAKSSINEATLAGCFERELYGLLKDIGFKFMPEKEIGIGTIRHVKKGRIDSKIGEVVIEYKHKTKLSTAEDKKKATEQLECYLMGLSKINSLQYYGFLTDGVICQEMISENKKITSKSSFVDFSHTEGLRLIKNIVLSDKTALTPKNLIKDFCNPNNTDNLAHSMAKELFLILKNNPTRKTTMLKLEWEQLFRLGHDDKSQQMRIRDRQTVLESIINDTFEKNEEQYMALFALQTTYAIIIKMIAYRIISQVRFETPLKSYHSILRANEKSLKIFCQKLEDGEIFKQLGITNLLEGDFFSWYSDSNQWNKEMAGFVTKILDILARYENTSEIFQSDKVVDLFKGLYENVIPHTVRSSLGEFYTPVWLAEHVFKSVKPKNNSWRGLDPCAGSGTFVLVMIDQVLAELKEENNETQLKQVLDRIHGIDLNPLSVLTTRINYFIRITHLIPQKKFYLQIPVYLGDASYVPEETETKSGVKCLKYAIRTLEKSIDIVIPKSLTVKPQKFSEIMTEYERKIKMEEKFEALKILQNNIPKKDQKKDVLQRLEKLTDDLIYLERKKWNGIWARIITNFLTTANLNRFDIVIGNPPWIDWKNLPSGYRERIKSLCIDRQLFSGDGMTGGINLNVCALITSVSIGNWLAVDGKLAFLMPKVIAFQQSYDGFRQFQSDTIKRDFHAFCDWTKSGHPFYPVKEKFMTFIIGPKNQRPRILPVQSYVKKRGMRITGDIHMPYDEAMKRLNKEKLFANQIMPHNTAFTITNKKSDFALFKKIAGESEYIGREGIEFYPQELLLFKKVKKDPAPAPTNCIYVENIQARGSIYRIPQDVIALEKEFLFPLVKGKEIQKFKNSYSGIIVPFPYDEFNPKKPIDKKTLSKKASKLLEYYVRNKEIIEQQTNYSDRIRGNDPGDFYGLARVGKYSFANYYVGFRDNTKWNACVISPIKMPWGEKKRMMFQNHAVSICEDRKGSFISEDEAHYICSILNAPIVEKYIIQSSDARSFKIRPPIKIPKFDPKNLKHMQLSILSKELHKDQSKMNISLEKIQNLYLEII